MITYINILLPTLNTTALKASDVLNSANTKGKGPEVGIDLMHPDLWVYAKRQLPGLQRREPREQGQR